MAFAFKKLEPAAPLKKVPSFRKLAAHTPEPEPEPKPRGAPAHKKPTPLEQKIIDDNGGALEVLPIPEKPLPDQELFEFQAQQMTAVENLMHQGIRSPHVIAQALKFSEDVAARYIKMVLARWQALGGDVDIKVQRGESLAYLDMLQNQLWTQYSAAKKQMEAEEKKGIDGKQSVIAGCQARMLNLNTQLMALAKQRTELYGLTPNIVNNLVLLGSGSENHEVLARMKKQTEAKETLGLIAAVLQRKKQEREAGMIVDV